MKHLYSVEGDFDLMMHWDDYFGAASGADVGETDAGESGAVADGGPAAGSKANKPKTNMLLLLIPWIVFWVAAAIDGFWGSLVSIAVCVLLPVLMRRTKATVYDQVSARGSCSVLHRVADGRVFHPDHSRVVLSVRGDVGSYLFLQSATDRALFEEQLQRGSGVA